MSKSIFMRTDDAALLLAAVLAVACGDTPTAVDGELDPSPSAPQLSIAGGGGSSGYPGAPDHHPELTQALAAGLQAQGGENRAGLQKNLSMIGFLDLQANPFTTSDVWALGNTAFVGGFGGGTTVKVVDISDPTNPQVVAQLPGAELFSSPQDVKAARINTRYYHGDLLAVANDGGAAPTFGGFQLFDVSNPSNPVVLSEPRIGPVHNLYLYQQGNRAYVLLAIPFAEVFSGLFGDFVVFDITDPRNPQMISDWGAGKDGGLDFGFPGFPGECGVCRGASQAVFLHDVWTNRQGTVAYLSYWDLGLVLLDISDPNNPTLMGVGPEPPTLGSDEGNAHNAVPAQDGNLVLVGDEDFAPGPWGFLRVFDTSDAANPVQIGAYATDGALNEPSLASSMHNIVVRGSRAYLSWYFEGIRIIDISQPSSPREIAAFLPPAGTSPGFFWGVYQHRDLVLASDILGGLYILKQEALGLP